MIDGGRSMRQQLRGLGGNLLVGGRNIDVLCIVSVVDGMIEVRLVKVLWSSVDRSALRAKIRPRPRLSTLFLSISTPTRQTAVRGRWANLITYPTLLSTYVVKPNI